MRERAKMIQAKAEKARKELLTPEEAAIEVKLPDPVEEGKAQDKIRNFMYSLRSDAHIWDFEMEDPALKVPHVMRATADPAKSYQDGRVQKIFEKI